MGRKKWGLLGLVVWVVSAPLAQAQEGALPFHQAPPNPSIGGMRASSAASMETMSQSLAAAMAQSYQPRAVPPTDGEEDSPAPPPRRVVVAPAAGMGRLGQVRAPAPALEGGMSENLRGMIVARLGADSCGSVTGHRMLKGGVGFRAQCDGGDVFEIRPTPAAAAVLVCGRAPVEADHCAP